MKIKIVLMAAALVFVVAVAALALTPRSSIPENQADAKGKIYITDRTGERWDVTQAAGLGFKPEGFQYGIGRWAFTTLDESDVGSGDGYTPDRLRIIGVQGKEETQAYSVRKLSRHEVANTKIDGKPIAVGY